MMKKSKRKRTSPTSTVRQMILEATQSEKPSFLPIDNPEFEKCSNAIHQLHALTDPRNRPFSLPSVLLPPI